MTPKFQCMKWSDIHIDYDTQWDYGPALRTSPQSHKQCLHMIMIARFIMTNITIKGNPCGVSRDLCTINIHCKKFQECQSMGRLSNIPSKSMWPMVPLVRVPTTRAYLRWIALSRFPILGLPVLFPQQFVGNKQWRGLCCIGGDRQVLEWKQRQIVVLCLRLPWNEGRIEGKHEQKRVGQLLPHQCL